MNLKINLFLILYLFCVVNAKITNINHEFNSIKFLNNILKNKDRTLNSGYDFNFYNNKNVSESTKSFQEVTDELLLYSEKFSNLTATERNDLINNHLDTYTSIIKLLMTSLLNKWSLSSQEQINSDYIYARNTILFSLEAFLDIDIDISIGTLNLDDIKNAINVLSASLYYDNNILSRNEYVNNNEIISYPAYSIIGRGYEIPNDYNKYLNLINNSTLSENVDSQDLQNVSDIEYPYGFDHQLSLALLGVYFPLKPILTRDDHANTLTNLDLQYTGITPLQACIRTTEKHDHSVDDDLFDLGLDC
ncbi:hypothetical protein LY90DRAFT_632631 [Neocallimastix californiae]|uniref:Uncharacterized protein n=1 Tax=Neocallimastix californiae TaxID=1754190 RepID=A0A1Y2AGI8_9FUNG|nr:hypothetical protein LY90DRAFT_632631 [Neocallimastix californiae]|eukprot:ORY21671.1 hypothetical protein LY90DRAFT_632631 [Neocallimastix californiae]